MKRYPWAGRPILVPVNEACRLLGGIGRTKFYELVKQSKIKTITIGRRRLVAVDSIYEMMDGTDISDPPR